MLAAGQTRIVGTSSGNTGAALAAYAAAAGNRCEVTVVETAPIAKLRQMIAYGAAIHRVKGFGLDPEITAEAFRRLQRRASAPGAVLQISGYAYSPVGMAGVESLGTELADQAPDGRLDHVFVQVGGGGLLVAVYRGLRAAVEAGRLGRMPAIHAVQPEGCATVVGPLARGENRAAPVACTTTVSGLQVASIVDGHEAVQAVRDSGGSGIAVPDQETYAIQARLAREEGLFCEPAAAITVAGAAIAREQGRVRPGQTCACLLTGSAFKDSASLERMSAADVPLVDVSDL
jgi:threonine synthase